jgi:hypothetical protein
MFWEEKIDLLKKNFSQTDFRDPFTEWLEILKKIESKFIIKNNANDHFTNWSSCLKNSILVKTIPTKYIPKEIQKLNRATNYYVVIVTGNSPTSKQLIYDCKPNSMEFLLSMAPGHFYIIDKKYKWLTFFKINPDNIEASILKSGVQETPFDV